MDKIINYKKLIKHYKKPDQSQWYGRIDSTDNYDAFRWHQWIQPLDLTSFTPLSKNEVHVALLGFASDEGVRRNQGRTGAAKGPSSIRKELRNLPCSFTQSLKLYDAGDIFCENCGNKLI